MAVYQCSFAVVPKRGVLLMHETIPEQIKVGIHEDEFEHTMEEFWARAQVQAKLISQELDTLLDRAHWGNDEAAHNWKTETKEIDLDAFLAFDPASSCIEEFSFRFDLRDPEVFFLQQMLALAKRHHLLIMDDQGRIAEPEPEPVWALVKQSRAYLFMTDREAFWRIVAKE